MIGELATTTFSNLTAEQKNILRRARRALSCPHSELGPIQTLMSRLVEISGQLDDLVGALEEHPKAEQMHLYAGTLHASLQTIEYSLVRIGGGMDQAMVLLPGIEQLEGGGQ